MTIAQLIYADFLLGLVSALIASHYFKSRRPMFGAWFLWWSVVFTVFAFAQLLRPA